MSMVSDFATENYLKAVVKAFAKPGRERLGTGELARLLGVTAGTATVMVQRLKEAGYLEYEPHQGCCLTDEGRVQGLRVLRRHRLIESFLVAVLDLDWSDVHEEAEALEHAVSERLIDAIDAYLGHPDRDPHGDPIPSPAQSEYIIDDSPLSALHEGDTARISRIQGNKDLLSYYRSEGLLPGTDVRVLQKLTDAGLAVVAVGDKEGQYALSALNNIFVEVI